MNETEKDLALSGYQETIRLQEIEIEKLKDIADLWKKAWKYAYDYSMTLYIRLQKLEECDDEETIAGLRGNLEKTMKERDDAIDERDIDDPMDGSRICDQDGNRIETVKTVEETRGIWRDRDDLDALCGIRD